MSPQPDAAIQLSPMFRGGESPPEVIDVSSFRRGDTVSWLWNRQRFLVDVFGRINQLEIMVGSTGTIPHFAALLALVLFVGFLVASRLRRAPTGAAERRICNYQKSSEAPAPRTAQRHFRGRWGSTAIFVSGLLLCAYAAVWLLSVFGGVDCWATGRRTVCGARVSRGTSSLYAFSVARDPRFGSVTTFPLQACPNWAVFSRRRDLLPGISVESTAVSSLYRGFSTTPGRMVGCRIAVSSWLSSAALATSVMGFVAPRFRRIWRRRSRRCTFCGYDLRASSDRCPECGTQIPNGGGQETKAVA